jgi:predicted permease
MKPVLEVMVGDIRKPLYVLLGATGCVLLIACLNVAGLLVARAAARRKELAIRAALGAGRLRLLREWLTESFLLTSAGGVLGVALAIGALQWLVRARSDFHRVEAIHLDGAAIAFTVGLMVLCALLTGLIASASTTENRQFTALKDTARGSSAGHGRTRLRQALLAAEVGLTVVLLVAAGLLMKSYARLRSNDPGCATENILTMRIRLAGGSYNDPAQRVNLFAALLERVRALPGVEAAGMTRQVPGNRRGGNFAVWIAEHPPLPSGVTQVVSDLDADPGYFQAMGIPILRGRSFDPSRRLDKANEAVINAAFARQYFPNENPIGKHLDYKDRLWEIVGVVGDTRYSLAQDPEPIQYYPLYAGLRSDAMLVVRARSNVEQQALPVQHILQQLDRDLAVSDVLTMDQLLNKNTVDASSSATLLIGFALLSLVLAAAGIFGVLSYMVAQRTNELGIRMALGAQRSRVVANVLADGMKPALLGLAGGLAVSLALVQLIRSLLFETRALDPAVFVLVSIGLIAVAAVACIGPAWRASRVDPIRALRTE